MTAHPDYQQFLDGRGPWKRAEVVGDALLLLGDCLEILPRLGGGMDAIVTDPPYGIGAAKMPLGKWRTSRMAKSDWDDVAPDLASLLALGLPSIFWGANNFVLPASRAFLIWDKGAGFRGRDFAECEQAWCSFDGNARVFSFDPLARGSYRDKQHPTQKPVELMQWCLGFLPSARSILDPYMGSGSTGVACVKLGRKFIGIEIDEGYFDIACERILKAYAQPDMFVAQREPEPIQQPLFCGEVA